MIKIIATSIVKEGKEQEFLEFARNLVKESQKEEGNLSYTLNQSIENPRQFCFIECWKDQAALDSHNLSNHFVTLVPLLAQCREKGMLETYIEV